eukprot:EC715189.1.p1 GENE.EC715189.1~~EC715189.1.p1  ORF type:complete len:134 (+),score=4.68 EC715189.1:2-403(+)
MPNTSYRTGTILALTAGFWAATAAVFGKFGAGDVIKAEGYMQIVLRVGCIGGLLICNAVMVNFFTKALRMSAPAAATALSAASNFFVTAVYGMAIFGEHLPLQWWLGALLIAGGVACLAMDNPENQTPTPAPQ